MQQDPRAGAAGGANLGPIVDDGKNLAQQALAALQGACDNILSSAGGAVQKISGDTLQVATDFIESHAPAGEIGDIVRGLVSAEATAAAPTLDRLSKAAVAGIAVFKTDVDSAIGHLERML